MDVEIIAFDVFGTWRSLYAPTLAGVLRGEHQYQPLDELHAAMLDQVAERHGLAGLGEADKDELVHAWYRLVPWPDTVPGLTALRDRHLLTPLAALV